MLTLSELPLISLSVCGKLFPSAECSTESLSLMSLPGILTLSVVPDLSDCVWQTVPLQGAPAQYSTGSLFLPGIIYTLLELSLI